MFESLNMLTQSDIGLYLLIIWSLIWKGLALWKSAGRKQKYWFLVMLVLNSAGILEILYMFYFSTPAWDRLKGKFNKDKKEEKREDKE